LVFAIILTSFYSVELYPLIHDDEGNEIIPEVSDQVIFELVLRLRQASVNPSLVLAGYKRKFRGRVPFNLLPSDPSLTKEKSDDTPLGGTRMTRLQRANYHHHRLEREMMEKMGVPSKTRVLKSLILKHRGEKAIVFCEYREEMVLLKRDLASAGIYSVLYDGSLSLKKRDDIVTQLAWTNEEIYSLLTSKLFQPKSSFSSSSFVPRDIVEYLAKFISYDVVIVQINSGNAGLNLQMCSRVYFTNSNWNPCTEIQAISRAHRIGQTRPVHAIKLILSGQPKSNLDGGDQNENKTDQNENKTNQNENNNKSVKTIDHRVLEVQNIKRKIMADILGDEDIIFNGHLVSVNNGTLTNTFEDTKFSSLNAREMVHLIGGD